MAYRENMIYNGKFGIADTSFSVSASIDVYGINTADNTVQANLPPVGSVPQYKSYTFKDTGPNAGSNNITIDGAGDQRIDGSTTYVINSNGGAVAIVSDGANWLVINKIT